MPTEKQWQARQLPTSFSFSLTITSKQSKLDYAQKTKAFPSSSFFFFSPSIHIFTSTSLCRIFMAHPCCTLALSASTADCKQMFLGR